MSRETIVPSDCDTWGSIAVMAAFGVGIFGFLYIFNDSKIVNIPEPTRIEGEVMTGQEAVFRKAYCPESRFNIRVIGTSNAQKTIVVCERIKPAPAQ